MKPLKIVKITPVDLSDGGGVETVVPLLAQGLSQRGHEVIVYSQQTNNRCEFEEFKSKPVLNPTFPFKVLRELARMRPSPDIIHSHLVLPGAFLGLLSQPDSAQIVTSHGYDIQVDQSISYGMRLKPHYNLLMKAILPMIDRHCIVSKSMEKDALNAGSPAENITVVKNPIPTPQSTLNNPKDIPETDYLLFIGRLHRKKNIPQLVELVSDLLRKHNIKFLIGGAGDDHSRIQERISQLGIEEHCEMLGYVSEDKKWCLYKNALAFLMNSTTEAFGITSIESMIMGTPVIAANRPPFNDYISDNYDGFLYENREDIESAIAEIRTDESLLSSNAKKTAEQYTVSAVAEEHEELYYKLH